MLAPLGAFLLGSTPRQAIAALAILAAVRAASCAAPLAVHVALALRDRAADLEAHIAAWRRGE